ncbi:MAG: AAA family ATPase [Limisphaerales bacterium]
MRTWRDIEAASDEQILAWAKDQVWALAMARCQQDAEWHAEGDVWTHTALVCQQLLELDAWAELARREQLILLFTALFHDSGKPATTMTDPDTGRVSSPTHALRSLGIVREALTELGCNYATREEIAMLVRFHGRPNFLLEKESPEDELIRLSWLLRHRLLSFFVLADTRGRDTESMDRPEDNLRLWQLVAEENGCFDQPYRFANDQARFLWFRGELSSLHYVPPEKFRCTVTLMSGLPGSGKDTWLERNRPELPVVALDDLRTELGIDPTGNQGEVVQLGRERCREQLRTGSDFAFNATNITRQTRKKWIDLFADYGARVKIVYVEPPLTEIRRNNRQRKSPVPEEVISKLFRRLEPPTLTECHALELVVMEG